MAGRRARTIRATKPKKPVPFETWLVSGLRKLTQRWPPIYETKNRAKYVVDVTHIEGDTFQINSINSLFLPFLIEDSKLKSGRRNMFLCNYCGLLWFDKRWEKTKAGRWRKRSGVAVDHIHPNVTPEKGGENTSWDEFIYNLFFGETQVLCSACHDLKSLIETKERADARRKRKERSLEEGAS